MIPLLLLAGALNQVGIDERPGRQLPTELQFRDQEGRVVTLGEEVIGEQPTILIMAWYECPMLCGLVLKGAVDAIRKIEGGSFRPLTISFDPRDTPERAARKRQSTLAEVNEPPPWPFLVGDRAAIDALTQALGFTVTFDGASKQYAHPSAIVVLTPDGRISRYLYGVSYPPKDLRLALAEAQAGNSGFSLSRVLMTCFRYGPSTNRYGPYLVGFFRIGSAIVLLTVGWALWRLRQREKVGAA